MWLRNLVNSIGSAAGSVADTIGNDVSGAANTVEGWLGMKKPDDPNNPGAGPAPTQQQAPLVQGINNSIQNPNARNGLIQLAQQQNQAATPAPIAPIKIAPPPPQNNSLFGNIVKQAGNVVNPALGQVAGAVTNAVKNPNIIPTTHYADAENDSGDNGLIKMLYATPQNFLNSPHDMAQGANTAVQGAVNNDNSQVLGGAGQILSGAVNGPGLLVGGLAEGAAAKAGEASARPLLQRVLINSLKGARDGAAYGAAGGFGQGLTANQDDPNGMSDQLYQSAISAVQGGVTGAIAGAGFGAGGTALSAGARGAANFIRNGDVPPAIINATNEMGNESRPPTEELNSLNPTGGIFVDHNPTMRAIAPLGSDMTTLDRTTGGNPNDVVTVYRGGAKGNTLAPGDYITTSKQLARDYAGTGNVIEQRVRKGDILDSKSEPDGGEHIYRPGASKELGGEVPKPQSVNTPEAPQAGKEFKSGTAPFTSQQFVDTTSQAPDFAQGHDNLERNLQFLTGTHHANNIMLDHMLGDQGFAPEDLEAAYHHAEDPKSPLTAEQAVIYNEHVKPLLDATKQINDSAPREAGEETPTQRDNYIHRIAQGKNSSYEKMLNYERSGASESATRKTTDSQKSRTYRSIEDAEGNRKLVALHTPKDEMGKSLGGKRVTEITGPDEEGKDLGSLKKSLPPQVREFLDPALDKKLNDIAGGLGINHERVAQLKGGRAGESEHAENASRDRTTFVRDEQGDIHKITTHENRSGKKWTNHSVVGDDGVLDQYGHTQTAELEKHYGTTDHEELAHRMVDGKYDSKTEQWSRGKTDTIKTTTVHSPSTIRTRAATAPDTILHEIGHQIDDRYGLQEHMFGGKRPTSDMILDRQIGKAKNMADGSPASHKAFMNDLAGNRADQLKLAHESRIAEAKSFLKSVRDEGGIATDTTLKTEMKAIPLNLRRREGLAPDEMARAMGNHGHYFENGDDFREALAKHLDTISTSGRTPSRAELLQAAHDDLSHGTDMESQSYQIAQKMAKSKDAMRLAEADPAVKALSEQKSINGELRDLADARTPERDTPWTYARKGEEKMAVMFQAYLHHPDLFKEVAPTAFERFTQFLASHDETKPILDIQKSKSLELASRVVGDKQESGEFIDKNGKHWQLGDATTKEIEAKTNTRYFKNPIANSAINHVAAANATIAKHFMETWKTSPDFSDHALKDGDGVPPANWRPADSPAFRGYTFDPETKEMLDRYMGGSGAKTTTLVGKAWDGVGNVAVQLIVQNPLIHGQNLYAQALVAAGNIPELATGMGAFHQSLVDAADPLKRMDMIQKYLRAGGHFESYGADTVTGISKILDNAGIPLVNKLNSGAMRDIDATLRASLFDASTRHGMDAGDAVKNIDTFMGDHIAQDHITSNFLIFYHWFRTQINSVYQMARHPLAMSGAIVNTIITGSILYGANKAWQAFTGNDNASTRTPGALGFIKDVYKAPGQIASGQFPTLVTNHINPLIKVAADQISGHQNFTDALLNTWQKRAGDAVNQLIPQSSQAAKIANGHQSPEEWAANQVLGLYTPHTAGTDAAPNFPAGSGFNSGDATAADAAGTAQNTNDAYNNQKAYYTAMDQAKQALSGDQNNLDTFNAYMERSRNAAGQTIQETAKERMDNAGMLFDNKAVRDQVLAVQAASPNHDPMWDLSGQDSVDGQPSVDVTGKPQDALKTVLNYQSMATGQDTRTVLEDENPWLKGFLADRANYFSKQTFNGNSVAAAGQPDYPTADPNTQSQLDQYDALAKDTNTTSAQKGAFLDSHPDVISQFNKQFAYTNQMRQAEGAPLLKGAPTTSPELQAAMKQYSALPSGTGAKTAWIKSNPDMYKQMTDFYMNDDVYNLAKNAGLAQYQGEDLNQKALKAISSLGTYDVHKLGNGQFILGGSGLGGGSGSSKSKSGTNYNWNGTGTSKANAKRQAKSAASKIPVGHIGAAKPVSFRPSNPVTFANKAGKNTTPKGPAGSSKFAVVAANNNLKKPVGLASLRVKNNATSPTANIAKPGVKLVGMKKTQGVKLTSKSPLKGVKIA